MHWTIAAPFNRPGDQWLAPFVPGDHTFDVVSRPGKEKNWHDRKLAVSGPGEWWDYWRQSRAALTGAKGGGVITVFPQLPAMIGLLSRVSRGNPPLVAWFFDTQLYGGIRGRAARLALANVDRFVVHSEIERKVMSEWLGLPIERFVFVPLQFGGWTHEPQEEDTEEPFVLAVGSGHRDFATLFRAVDKLGYRTVVISSPRALAGLSPPPNVEILEGIQRDEIRRMVQRARINAIPMNTEGVVAGTVTVVETMVLGRAPVLTYRTGVEDYVTDDVSGIYVEPFDVSDMAESLERMWTNPALRSQLNAGAKAFADQNCTDEAAGKSLGLILDDVEAERGRR